CTHSCRAARQRVSLCHQRVSETHPTPTPRFAPWIPISVIWLLGAIPAGVWAGMFVHAFRASRFLGRWPHANNPAPKALPPHIRSESLETAIGVALITLIITLGIQFTR